MKRLPLFLLLLSACVFSFLPGCDPALPTPDQAEEEPVHLVYYTIGTPDPDLAQVESAINEVLREKINVTIDYRKINWNEYGSRLTTMINSNADFDIAFAASSDQGDYVGNAKKGAWLPLDDYLQGIAQETYEAINPLFWEGVKIDGTIYGIPTNKEIAVPLHFSYAQSLVNKYDIDISAYQTLESLEPLFELIHEKEPDYITFDVNASASNYFAIDGYEYLISSDIPLMVRSSDPNVQIVNIFATPYCQSILNQLHNYYQKGYINEDAPLKEAEGFEEGVKAFFRIAEGGPYSATTWSNDRKYSVVSHQVSDSVVTTESTRGSLMVVNAKTQHPEACLRFLNCLNTDPEVRNLFNYGIEGQHYALNDNGQVHKLNNSYAGVQYTQGNWFILKTQVGEPLDKWEQFELFNSNARYSEALGFTPDTSEYTELLSSIRTVNNKYYPCLMTGCVDAEVFLPRFLEELEQAGLSILQQEMQRQLNEWKKQNDTIFPLP